jgi:hypothetical protein
MSASLRRAIPVVLSIISLLFTPKGHCLSGTSGVPHLMRRDTARATVESDSANKQHYLSSSLSYGNNSSFLGRFQSRTMPYLGADVTVMHRKGFWVSAMAYDIVSSPIVVDEIDLMAGWSFDISKKWDASLFYGRYFFPENTELLKSYVANSASVAAGFDWSILYTRLSSAYIFGNDIRDVFLILDNSHYFEFPNILGGDYVSIDPQVSLIAGTQTFYEQFVIEEEIPRNAAKGKDKGKGKGTGKGNGQDKVPSGGSTTEFSIVENETRSFNLMSYEVSLPVMYTRGNWSFETSGRYAIPVNTLEGYLTQPQFFFTSTLYYTISSKK